MSDTAKTSPAFERFLDEFERIVNEILESDEVNSDKQMARMEQLARETVPNMADGEAQVLLNGFLRMSAKLDKLQAERGRPVPGNNPLRPN